jgi:hypothetical protein
MKRREVSSGDDLIDSRDVIQRIEDLTDEGEEASEDDKAELSALVELQRQAEGYCDWEYGVTLIRDSHFKAYARELAEDIGAINSADSWPAGCIDWDEAAKELQMDYTQVSFDGVDYWLR